MEKYRLNADQLTCKIPIEDLRFETTEDLTPLYEMIGQERAAKAMEFGLNIKQRGYNSVCNICPFCQKQLGSSQEVAGKVIGKELQLPSMYLSQYIGLAVGLDEEQLGLNMNLTGWEDLVQ